LACWFRISKWTCKQMTGIDVFHFSLMTKQYFPAIYTNPYATSYWFVFCFLSLSNTFAVHLIKVNTAHIVDETVTLERTDWNYWIECRTVERSSIFSIWMSAWNVVVRILILHFKKQLEDLIF
jgi:hypothetical protein